MAARTTRKDARARLIKTFMDALDRVIPEDESKPLKGSRFRDWEDQAAELKRELLPTLLEERAALAPSACVSNAGACPHCGSDRTYLEKQTTPTEVITPDGPVVIEKQNCRCRCCDGSFSPSEP